MRALPVALVLTVALIGAGCAGGDEPASAERTRAAQETPDAAALFVEELPRGVTYGPPPKGERERLTGVFEQAGMEDLEVRLLRRHDGARALAVGMVSDEDMVMGKVAAGIALAGGKTVPEDIDGVPFHVGVDKNGNFIAMRAHGNGALWVYAATRRDARSFARPFAQHLTG